MTDKPECVLRGLPDGVESVMFLRDGWPKAIVCKVLMKTGHIGVGLFRNRGAMRLTPAQMDEGAILEAMANISGMLPDYTELHEHIAKVRAEAEARGEAVVK